MIKKFDEITAKVNSKDAKERLEALKAVSRAIAEGVITREESDEVNNHVHTTYSFSPYEPAMAALKAWQAGLQIVGSIDHDSISAAPEMLAAGRIIGMATTVGFEVRCSFLNTPLKNRKINNPDSKGIAYMCVHGVPADKIDACKKFLAPVGIARNRRNRSEVAKLNELIGAYGMEPLDFEADVASLSRREEGGSITERHILSALAGRIMRDQGIGEPVVTFLEEKLAIPCSGKVREVLLDAENPHYRYDLLGILKSNFLPAFFIQPESEEIIEAKTVVDFARSIGAIPAYAYLGDVTESPTGDKLAEQFEDSYLDELFAVLSDLGYLAVTYMPPRNSLEQLLRVQDLARKHNLMEISGVDINSSRQSFNCPEMLAPEFVHLLDSAWALVAHEKLSAGNPELGLFHMNNPLASLSQQDRIAAYGKIGRELDVTVGSYEVNEIKELLYKQR